MVTDLFAAFIFAPNSAVLVMSLGILGIYAEFCRPGRAIPGALGAAMVVLGLASLLRFPLSYSALFCISIAVVMLALEAVGVTRGFCTLLASGAMFRGLSKLIDTPNPALHIRWSTALFVAVPLTLATGFLLSAAMAARRTKISMGATAFSGALPGGTIS